MSLAEKELVSFMERFDARPFQMVIHGNHYLIGEGRPDFTVFVHRLSPVSELLKSTSLALGEAYMHGDIEIRGDLYEALYSFLGQMGKFFNGQQSSETSDFYSCVKAQPEKGSFFSLRYRK